MCASDFVTNTLFIMEGNRTASFLQRDKNGTMLILHLAISVPQLQIVMRELNFLSRYVT